MNRMKFLSLSVLSTVIITTTPVLAASNTPAHVTNISNEQVKVESSSTSTISIKLYKYTYSNAPESVKKQYEEDCKSLNIKPDPSHVILVPENNIGSLKTNENASIIPYEYYTIHYNTQTAIITCVGSHAVGGSGTTYTASVTRDYVGYYNETSGSAVVCLQLVLGLAGYPNLAVDGIFGANTHSAVVDYQSKHNLSVDGTVGPNTWLSMLSTAHLR